MRRHLGVASAAAFAALCAFLPCGAVDAKHGTGFGKLRHVVIIVQEGRSFDNLFCAYPGANAAACGKPLQPIKLEAACTLSDTFEDFERDRKTGNFSDEKANCPGHQRPEYAYVPHRETTPYFTIANQYVLGDNMFSSTGNPTFEAHQFAIAAESAQARDEPFGSTPPDGCVYLAKVRQFSGSAQPACFSYKTLGSELTAAGLSWKYYRAGDRPVWDAYGWINGSAGSSWYTANDVAPSTQFLTDVAAGNLAAVTWVTPDLANSDLSGSLSASGPAWVEAVVNAVGESQFWDTSAIFVTWSGFGGWYDHVPPPYLDYEGLGFRIPLLIVSPYAKQNYVSHVEYETGSLLRFTEDVFGLERLAVSDRRSNSPATDTFNFKQAPRPFTPI